MWGERREGELSGKKLWKFSHRIHIYTLMLLSNDRKGKFLHSENFLIKWRGEKSSEDKEESGGIKLLRESSNIGNIEKLMSLHCSDPFL